jgi:methyl-accepting chemotaxis protein
MRRVRITIGRKLAVLVVLEIAAIVVILGVSSYQMRATLMEERRQALRNVVDAADSTVKHYARLAEQGKLTAEQAQAQALAGVGALRYAGSEYVWINDLGFRMLSHPSAKLQGTNVADLTDASGKRFLAEMVDKVKRQGDGHVEYEWRRSEGGAPALKISYARGTSWGWVVATGLYADDVIATASARTLQLGAILLVIAAGLVGLSALLGRTITGPLRATVASLDDLAEGGR